MSSDGYFEGDDFDDAAFDELDAIEAAALQSQTNLPPPTTTTETQNDSYYDLSLDIDENDLSIIDKIVNDAYLGKAQPTAGPSLRRTGSATHQTTLFGDILPQSSTVSTQRSQIQRTKSTPRNPFGKQPTKSKVWDQTAFAKTGLKSGKSKGKGKQKYDDEESDEEAIEFEQFPAPFVSAQQTLVPLRPPPPMKLAADLLEAKHWIYPLNRPKRDYQFNIVKRCLFDNTIVALPTGLGKTFIAGVIMLNYYRWFPEGKIVFVAPTKPLVAQQIEACHQACGIPGCDAAELTGQIARAARGRLWKEKRIFYMTPQTLVNDLVIENCDVRDIVLLVIDEAHRATGDYAYNQVVRFLMAKNPHHRILALTATPGGNPDAVQNLVDGLHISHIEIRDENSLDLKQYIHHKRIEQHIINMSEDVNKVKNPLAALINVRKFLPQFSIYISKEKQNTREISSLLETEVEGTLGMCHTYIQELSHSADEDSSSAPGKAAASAKKKGLREDPMFQAVLRELEKQKVCGFSPHPKMDRVRTLIIDHFAQRLPDEGDGPHDETRAMVFVTFREAVDEIVEALNAEQPLIRAHKFIGQGTDKQGKKGLAQKEQLDIIQRFKAGEWNVLVATSIGEEGLDIGEVDLIVCYDAQKTPIRMLQRLGRTGRKREGVVHVLLAEGREELNLEKAKDTYKEVQKTILRGEQLEFYSDVPRLLPSHIKPECLERVMEIQEYVRDNGRKRSAKEPRSPKAAGVKRKRNDDISRNIPAGASTGFVSVADLLVKGSKKQKKAKPSSRKKDFENAGNDDDTDMDLESGIVNAAPRRAQSSASTPAPSKRRGKNLRRSKTAVSKNTKLVDPSSSQFSARGQDDQDDLDIEGSIALAPVSSASSHPENQPSTHHASSSNAVLELSDSEENLVCNDTTKVEARESMHVSLDDSMAWLVNEDEDDNPTFEIVDSSPIASRITKTRTSAADNFLDGLADQSIEFVERTNFVKHSRTNTDTSYDEGDESIEFLDDSVVSSELVDSASRSHKAGSPLWPTSSSPGPPSPVTRGIRNRRASSSIMPPPVAPRRPTLDSSDELPNPEPSFPVRQLAGARRRTYVDSPSIEISSPVPRRLQRWKSPVPNHSRKSRPARVPVDPRTNPAFDIEAEHSGDDVSEGSSGPEEEETEEDRRFLQELPETQVSPSYDQSLAYRQSLFTQAPAGAKAPAFSRAPIRRGTFGLGGRQASRRRLIVSSSPPQADEEVDEYMLDSFVVDDDAEISFLSD
ncbi:hypothetical protein H0H92_004196 [Tricholoma furcatifolium]|nr:hypothetical protein H0H92_004196 [Tricholoma furcatifolium]